MEIFGIKLSKNELYLLIISAILMFFYIISFSHKFYIEKVKNEYFCVKKICIKMEYYTKCIEFDKPQVFSLEKIQQGRNYKLKFIPEGKICK